ncbi:MAG: hypothetical protein V4517_15960, partial [Pseudomonadota bacterium]
RAMTGVGVARSLDPSLRVALATKQSILSLRGEMDCFAALAMTLRDHPHRARDLPSSKVHL